MGVKGHGRSTDEERRLAAQIGAGARHGSLTPAERAALSVRLRIIRARRRAAEALAEREAAEAEARAAGLDDVDDWAATG